MKIEIWSDVMCPFCYIGKRRFEEALAVFEHRDDVTVEWRSFQLNPTMKTDPSISVNEYLAEVKGWQLSYAKQLNDQVTQMAAEVGLTYDFDRAIVANSFDAHQLVQFAKQHGKGDAAEEAIFKAYFTLGKNIADHDVLADIAEDIDLDAEAFKQKLNSGALKDAVHEDLRLAEEFGIHSVPFFVIDRKFAVSGAQPATVFSDALTRAYTDQSVEAVNGDSCDIDGNC